jgi:hypothetical protein
VIHLSAEAAFWRAAGDKVRVIDDPDLIRSALQG